jgi:hypothetical protein
MIALFGWQFANEVLYSTSSPRVTLDWDSPGFGRGFASQVMFRFFNESYYMFAYWLLGVFFDDIETLTLGVGLVRSFESLGTCLAFAVGAVRVPPMTNLIVACVMFFVAVPFTSWLVWLVPERPERQPIAAGPGAGVEPDEEGFGEKHAGRDEDVDARTVAVGASAVDGPRS